MGGSLNVNGLFPSNQNGPIYLDYQSTTPTDPRVLNSMMPFFFEKFGNPHSDSHSFGWAAEDAVEQARADVARLIGAEPKEIIFTSGGTEANNLAIMGLTGISKRGNHIITTEIEHKCVLEACGRARENGLRVTYLAVPESGVLEIDTFIRAIEEDTFLVSIMGVNNETGVIQPLEEIGLICSQKNIYFHSDCSQAIGKIPIDVNRMKIDLMSISGHKFYGPMGIGALFVRRRPRVYLTPLFEGGGQERGLRSGTLPVPLCVGLGEAAKLAELEMPEEITRLETVRDLFLSSLLDQFPNIRINGTLEKRIPGNLNLCLPDVDAGVFLTQLSGVAISTGAACLSGANQPSYVLRAMGLTDSEIKGSIRIGFGRFTTLENIECALRIMIAGIQKYQSTLVLRDSRKNEM